MSQITVSTAESLRGQISVPGDKSISHRTLLLGSLAQGRSHIRGFLPSADCLATLGCIQELGIAVDREGNNTIAVRGRGLQGLHEPRGPLDCARSGTTMRLLAGILAGQSFDSVLAGDAQLLHRPMERIAEPLREMGVQITTAEGHGPLTIRGGTVRGGEHRLPVPSAQVKSAILLAGLYAEGPTIVHQPGPARDHTERMLADMGANIEVADLTVTLTASPSPLNPLDLTVPGDVSSACFPLAAALVLPGSRVTVERTGVNSTRTGLFDVLREMGAQITIESRRVKGGEPVADVTARSSSLRGVSVSGDTVVRMIDEFPLLAVTATQARGATVVRDAAELRVKETDRIAAMAAELSKMGARIEPRRDGFVVSGPTPLHGTVVDSHGDHRIAMALSVAGLVAEGKTIVRRAGCIRDSFPGFARTMQRIGAGIA